jgi:hypothetical protein
VKPSWLERFARTYQLSPAAIRKVNALARHLAVTRSAAADALIRTSDPDAATRSILLDKQTMHEEAS